MGLPPRVRGSRGPAGSSAQEGEMPGRPAGGGNNGGGSAAAAAAESKAHGDEKSREHDWARRQNADGPGRYGTGRGGPGRVHSAGREPGGRTADSSTNSRPSRASSARAGAYLPPCVSVTVRCTESV